MSKKRALLETFRLERIAMYESCEELEKCLYAGKYESVLGKTKVISNAAKDLESTAEQLAQLIRIEGTNG